MAGKPLSRLLFNLYSISGWLGAHLLALDAGNLNVEGPTAARRAWQPLGVAMTTDLWAVALGYLIQVRAFT